MKTPLWLTKWLHYEYWPTWVFYLPLVPYYLYQVLKNQSFTFPILANPSIEMGGLFGTSKYSILQKIAPKYLPKTLLVKGHQRLGFMSEWLEKEGLSFPVIAKPDVGERGFGVKLIQNRAELEAYQQQAPGDFLVQEYINYPLEMGIFYSRLPNLTKGKVSSVTLKEFMAVQGNGHDTVEHLMQENPRFGFQIEATRQKLGESGMAQILGEGQSLLIEPIGNHCRGTKFLNGNHLINKELEAIFEGIAQPIEGIYYGRFDIRVPSLADLYAGRNIKVLELNGINSEPTHVYDPTHGLWAAYHDVLWHWQRVAAISRIIREKGGIELTAMEVIKKVKIYNRYKNGHDTRA